MYGRRALVYSRGVVVVMYGRCAVEVRYVNYLMEYEFRGSEYYNNFSNFNTNIMQ